MKALLLSLTALALTACTTAGQNAGTQTIDINFAAEIKGKPFVCGQSYSNVGVTRSTITPSDFRLYVSEIKLIKKDGSSVPVELAQDGVWQYQNLALLDFEDGQGPCLNGTSATNTRIRATAPAGSYSGIELTVGVPFKLNHQDPTVAAAPLNSTAMFWNWQGGYKFIKFDTASTGIRETQAAGSNPSGVATRYSVHLGSTVCASASRTQAPVACQNANRIAVRLDGFDPSKNQVVIDMGAALARANVDVNAQGTSPGCMSFPKDADCPPVMGALGLAYDGVPAPGAQQLIRLR